MGEESFSNMRTGKITNRQTQILLLLYRFRFLNRHHLQLFLNHKDPHQIKTWLKNLTDQKVLNKIYYENKPAIYFLNSGSLPVLKDQGLTSQQLKKVYREKTRSRKFVSHCLFLADIYFHFARLLDKSGTLHFYTKADLSDFDYLFNPLPDAYIAIKKGKVKRYFLEIVDEKAPRFVLEKLIEKYFDYYQDKIWQQHTRHPFPSVLLICPTQSVIKTFNEIISDEDGEISFFLTTKDKFTDNSPEIWEKA
jgi:hypothetical protein